MTESEARRRFSQGLVGCWASYLGGGHDMHIGMKLTFHEDGSGVMEEWGFDHQHIDPNYVTTPEFKWKSVADRTIEITHRSETRSVEYDFKAQKNEYDIVELRLFETGRTPDEHGEVGFWVSPFSLVYRGSESNSLSLFQRLRRKIRR